MSSDISAEAEKYADSILTNSIFVLIRVVRLSITIENVVLPTEYAESDEMYVASYCGTTLFRKAV